MSSRLYRRKPHRPARIASVPTKRALWSQHLRCGLIWCGLLWAALDHASALRADDPPRLRPDGIDGAIVITGGDRLPDVVARRFVELAGGAKAHLLVLALRDADHEAAEQD